MIITAHKLETNFVTYQSMNLKQKSSNLEHKKNEQRKKNIIYLY